MLVLLMLMVDVWATTLPLHGSQGLGRNIDNVDTRPAAFRSEDDKSNPISRRTGMLTGSAGDWDLTLTISDQLIPVQIAAGAIERFYQSVMGKSISYSLTNRRNTSSLEFRKGALVLMFRCLTSDRSGCLPWPLVTVFAQYMMQRAQTGFTGQYVRGSKPFLAIFVAFPEPRHY